MDDTKILIKNKEYPFRLTLGDFKRAQDKAGVLFSDLFNTLNLDVLAVLLFYGLKGHDYKQPIEILEDIDIRDFAKISESISKIYKTEDGEAGNEKKEALGTGAKQGKPATKQE